MNTEQATEETTQSRLSKEVFVEAALRVAKTDTELLSMRTLAEEVGASTMASYRHVRGKSGLLAACVDALLGRALADWDKNNYDDIRDAVLELAASTADLLKDYPQIAAEFESSMLGSHQPSANQWGREMMEAFHPAMTVGVNAIVWTIRGMATEKMPRGAGIDMIVGLLDSWHDVKEVGVEE